VSSRAVLIAGAGPTGLMLAGELALAGADVEVFEQRTDRTLAGSRAAGMTPRTIEVLDQRGIADRFLAQGRTITQGPGFAGITMDLSGLLTRHSYVLALLQYRVERILADWVHELGVAVHYGREVIGFTQDPVGVEVTTADGTTRRGAYLVGCDGGRSLIRKTSGIAFPGWEPSTSCLVADVDMIDEPPWGLHRHNRFHSFFQFDGEDTVRVMVTEPHVGNTHEPTLTDISAALIDTCGTDYGLRSATWISRFTDATRQAATYRDRRVLLAGDAAHTHFPIGGQGLNTGIQDAVNLGWKLGQVANGTSDDRLLDTYHAERHPVGARVLHDTMAQTALNGPGARVAALRDVMTELFQLDEPRTKIANTLCGLDIRYDLGPGHPLLGRRMPDLNLITADGRSSVFALLHDAQGILLQLQDPFDIDLTRWAPRVSTIRAQATDEWNRPELGRACAPTAVLIRPDGHIAWVSDNASDGLPDALDSWFAR
jgi:2-polyprenyl-6-methoxyphenol hydroxylase-like FAD-dependent oxidoreductase